MDILFTKPCFTHNIWGGTRLRDEYGYEVEGDVIGECWGIAAHENGDVRIEGREETLSELYKKAPEMFGSLESEKFPLLIKIIDAKSDLSIQVHPDDAYAKENENGSFGKMECWYILDAPENASLVVGHNAQTRAELADMIDKEQWKELIREVPVKAGDFIQIDPGTVHAIKGGIVLLETQQNSDITYRLYDYDRLENGKKRPLHIRQSIDVIEVPAKNPESSVLKRETIEASLKKNELYMLEKCSRYTVFLLETEGECAFEQKYPFLNMTVVRGEGTVNGHVVKKGTHMVLPCGFGEVAITGDMQIVCSCPTVE